VASNESLQSPPPPWVWPRAAYIHIPFCAHRCGYCDFAIAVGRDSLADQYLSALDAELASLGSPQPLTTLFIGGGTPTHLSASQLRHLFHSLHLWFATEENCEISVEANPETLDDKRLDVMSAAGVTRISLGAQSFHPHLLQVLNRQHGPEHVARAAEQVKKRKMQLSLDLIFGAPGQTLHEWQEDLQAALAIQPDHLSTYGLTYEKGTPLWKRRREGEIQSLQEEEELALYVAAINALEGADFEHYEISSFARPGSRCRHNQVYWANNAYFGFGMGAARYVQGRRERNTRDLTAYMDKALAGQPVTVESEALDPWEQARETMAVQLRRQEGICRDFFYRRTGYALAEVAGKNLALLIDQELLLDDDIGVRLSRNGKYVADGVIERLLK
jgi:oxygen-independent coproporphyrinogen-3 oxidase